jgi:ribonuclease PH
MLRPVTITRGFVATAAGSALYRCGNTVVLCTASIDEKVPDWMLASGKGWVTAEYNMLPASTSPRKPRERMKVDGRTTEIQRLIGRSLRAVVDMAALGPRQVTVDCDVLQADGGTRTASITGGWIALADALEGIRDRWPDPARSPLLDSVAAISVGIVDGTPSLDLDYDRDSRADVDMNIVMTGGGRFVEVQGTGEQATFDQPQLLAMLDLARQGIAELTQLQSGARKGSGS